MNIIIAFIVFGIIVLVHEFGHYIVAKKNGIFVEEFAIGMGPKLISKQMGETVYSLRILPIGGFCKMLGEESASEDLRSFSNKSVGARMSVIAAGPFMNFLLAFIIIGWLASIDGFPIPVIRQISQGYPAERAQLLPGDRILSINDQKIRIYQDLQMIMLENQGEPIQIMIQRESEIKQVGIVPQQDTTTGQWLIGFSPSSSKGNIGETLVYSFWTMIFYIRMTVTGFVKIVTGQVGGDQVAGPIGIVQMIGQTYQMGLRESIISAIQNVAYLAALLSTNLGALNLFPIPALDGSRLVFLGVEAIRRKPLNAERENMIHFVGFVLLMIFMVFVAYNDIIKLF